MSSDSGLPHLRISTGQPWFAILSSAQQALVGLAVGAFIFLSGGVLDWFVTHRYIPRISLMLAGAAMALTVGLLVFKILTDVRERYQELLDRLRRIVELNHHIRNALQIIAYHNVAARTERAIQQVNVEILRIESVLREVSSALGEHSEFPSGAVS